MIGACFRGTVRTAWRKRRFFGEIPCFTEAAVNLVGRNLMEAYAGHPHRIAGLVFARHPRFPRGIEQVLRPENICHEKQLRIFDASVHMALGREIDDVAYRIFLEQSFN